MVVTAMAWLIRNKILSEIYTITSNRCVVTIVYFLQLPVVKRFTRHSACLKTKKSRHVNENAKDMSRREQLIEQIYIVECSQRYSKHVKCRLERFKRPAAVK